MKFIGLFNANFFDALQMFSHWLSLLHVCVLATAPTGVLNGRHEGGQGGRHEGGQCPLDMEVDMVVGKVANIGFLGEGEGGQGGRHGV